MGLLDNQSLFLKNDNTAWACGYNEFGALGDGTTTNRLSPVQIGSATNWSFVAAGREQSFAINSNGQLFAWGNNANGELGLGDTQSRIIPTLIAKNIKWE